MISFNDTTYCNNPNCDGSCGRQWTSALQQKAIRWWCSENAPVAFADFHERHEKIKQHNWRKTEVEA